ncbi:DUF6083 domain-containing protein [Streptomyces sp. NPDC085612]|uniref:DUF6083 domain-containing protein n=1 Tax=Streptomyces sp. NPDC085612 TaxID=3365732 RepID=UPI0037CDEB5A
MRLHPSTPSKGLRGNNVARCTLCGHHVWYFDREDGGRIPLLPTTFPTRAVPWRARWSVDAGLARYGDMGQPTCWIAHPTLCPGVEHEDDDADLWAARRALAWRTRKAVEQGRFSAALPVPEEAAEDAQEPEEVFSATRHIVDLFSSFLIGPDAVDKIRCVSVASSHGGRCGNTVYDDKSSYLPEWVEVPVPFPPGRLMQDTLWAGQTMWVCVFTGLDREERTRWRQQRCTEHGEGSTLPDAAGPEWQHFSLFRHEAYVLSQKPPEAERPKGAVKPKGRVLCSAAGCNAGKVGTVHPDLLIPGVGVDGKPGWLCWKCRKKYKKRLATHERWRNSDNPQTPGS